MVAFGRPKGRRGSYMQWQEDGIPPQVVFEILSPGNRAGEMATKLQFYDRYGVEEYYLYDPERISLKGWHRVGNDLESITSMNGWFSPRLGIQFVLNPDLVLYFPDGTEFSDYVAERQKVELERQKTELERQRADMESQRANQAERAAERERLQAEIERERANQLAERLRSLGIEV